MIFCTLYCMCIILYQYFFFIICMHYKVHVTYIVYPMYKLYVTSFIWHFLLFLYSTFLIWHFLLFLYSILHAQHSPFFTQKTAQKSGYSHLSTRSIHLLLCVLYQLRFTEGAEQSNLLQCLCNTEKDN